MVYGKNNGVCSVSREEGESFTCQLGDQVEQTLVSWKRGSTLGRGRVPGRRESTLEEGEYLGGGRVP